ncbi:glycosyltransferase family A protein [Acidisoma sp. S159]|uniref:glycosyltransferase family A protein n=1 Tax=Acidisoma sp. S159 TaxID=1747225 RepID=UPI00131EB378|nr:glycosyltransferase family A protein [Acidisoma sp. S159]
MAEAGTLAQAFSRGRQPRLLSGYQREAVTVAVVTRGERASLSAAVSSVAAQDYGGKIRLMFVGDGLRSIGELPPFAWPCERVRFLGVASEIGQRIPWPVSRIAGLRNLAVAATGTPLITFLDDDNLWRPDHLSTLVDRLKDRAAVYSWRRLIMSSGQRWEGREFPWAPKGKLRERLLTRMEAEGVIRAGEDVVRDCGRFSDGTSGMVDLGAWLFRTEALGPSPFCTHYDAVEQIQMVGEDDKLLANLVSAGLDLPCTEEATLIYTLGGLSNGGFNFEVV